MTEQERLAEIRRQAALAWDALVGRFDPVDGSSERNMLDRASVARGYLREIMDLCDSRGESQ